MGITLVILFLLMSLTASMARAESGGFLFVTFKGESTPMTEQLYFAVSKDGLSWQALKGGQPTLVSKIGEKGVRDPYLLRSHDGKKYFLIATDLSINLNPSWNRAVTAGSRSILVWESTDLVKWSEPRLVQVAPDGAGCTWAPEAIYDTESKDYLVFWASTTAADQYKKHRIWACRTADFVTFGKPFVYIEKSHTVIDTDIVFDGKVYYRFSKDEASKAITMEVSDKLSDGWRDVPKFSLAKLQGVEGPQCFLREPATDTKPANWCLLLDHYARSGGYHAYVSNDLAAAQFEPTKDMKFPFKFRHGSVLAITPQDYDRLKAAYR